MSLYDFDAQQFLDRDWQQRPRLLRQALPGFCCPVDGNDLAGLACEPEAESRIIIEDATGWHLRHGPFSEADFSELPPSGWTLLVQGVDRWLPEVAELLQYFRFLPRWRTEDIMISYAADGGNVGPHFDNYDVFLIQGSGQRRWRIGQHCDDATPLLDNDQLRLIAEFTDTEEYLLAAGDILYIPPGVAHWGAGVGDDCITLSVGFRAPSSAELIGHWADEVASHLGEAQRYRDPALNGGANPGEIPDVVVAQLRRELSRHLDDDSFIRHWFGQLMTSVEGFDDLSANHEMLSEAEFVFALQETSLALRLGTRLAFDNQYLFADGQSYCYSDEQRSAIAELCKLEANATLVASLSEQLGIELLYSLYCAGTLEFDDYEPEAD